MEAGRSSAAGLLGRFLQATALVLLPVGLYEGVVRERGMTVELTLLGVGAGLFLLGRALQPAGK